MSHGERRKALIVGINAYKENPLYGCENDANTMARLLSKHEKMDPNFDCLKFSKPNQPKVSSEFLKSQIEKLFKEEVDMALFYFSGHGTNTDDGFALVTADYPDPGCFVELTWIIDQIQKSPAEEVILILDCCHAGGAGNNPEFEVPTAHLRKGVTVLAATSSTDVATEINGHGKFTKLLARGLEGAAIDMVGHVTTASLYAYADSFLTLWEQKPVYKTHTSGLTALRYCLPKLPKIDLRRVTVLFPNPNDTLPLHPGFLPEPENDRELVQQLRTLKRLRRHGFVEGTHLKILSWEAKNKGGCRLTESGKDLHTLVLKNKI